MVIFSHKKGIERALTRHEMEREMLHQFENSDEWKKHQEMHARAKMGEAKLFIPNEPVLGEKKDVLRERLGLRKEEARQQEEQLASQPKGETVIYKTPTETATDLYKPAPTAGGATYQGAHDPSRPGYWATCNCGSEFHLNEDKKGNIEVKSYTVESSLKPEGNYGTSTSATTYTSPSAEKRGSGSSNPAYT